MTFVVAAERLGRPGEDSGMLERLGILQRQLRYPIEPDVPTELCHLQRSSDENALCGFPWERLILVPGAVSLDDIDEELRCRTCGGLATQH